MLRFLLKLFQKHPQPERSATGLLARQTTPKRGIQSRTSLGPQEPRYRVISGKRTIAANLEAGQSLYIVECPRLQSIGTGLKVMGDLTIGGPRPGAGTSRYELRRIPIEHLPEGLTVSGSLALRSCFRLRQLSPRLFVGASMLIQDCDALSELPPGMEVKGSLRIIGGRSLTALPPGLHVRGDLRLAGTAITTLPPDLRIDGSLTIEGRSRITSLPPTIHVGKDIVLGHSQIRSIPDALPIRRSLHLRSLRHLTELPEGLSVPGDLHISRCSQLTSLPQRVRVGQNLSVTECIAFTTLPEHLEVPGALNLRGCTALNSLPKGLRVGLDLNRLLRARGVEPPIWRARSTPALRITGCTALTQLPEDLELGGPIDLAGSGLTDLPPALAATTILWRGVLAPADIVFHPESLDPERILQEPNAELRRMALERVGLQTVLQECEASAIDTDTDSGGPRRLLHLPRLSHRYLHCRCPSTGREYLLRVPPTMATCHQAAAWLAGFDNPADYHPVQET